MIDGRSPWGPQDELGAANELTTDTTRAALALARTGRIFDLSLPISANAPRLVGQSPYTLCMWTNPLVSRHSYEVEVQATNGIGFADERVEFDLHTGTHIDALGHTTDGDRMYNGFRVEDGVGNQGLIRLGIENLPPVISRGVLLDMTLERGRPLDGGEAITEEDLRRCLLRQGVSINPGDIVLVRTGWSAHYGVDNRRYVESSPGITLGAARWLAAQHVTAVGADTMGLEVVPEESSREPYPVHQYLLARAGVYIIEQANLEEIGEARAYEFLCLCLAPRFEGGTAAPIRLTAVI